jgi:hypothetical protein
MSLIDSQIHVAIKSYKRAGLVRTLAAAPFAWVWVPESQEADYRHYYGDRVRTIPDAADGNLCRKSNAILDRSPCPWTLILDDDISRIGCWEDGKRIVLDADALAEVIEHCFLLAADLGVHLWGINQNKDPLIYQPSHPFALLAPILGPFNGHLEPVLRYDESVLGKDDYDFWLQNIRKYHKTLRFNRYHYEHDHGNLAGGFVSMRTLDVEQRGVTRLRQKWGTRVFRPGGTKGGRSATGKNILNSKITIPIAGC